MLIFLVLSKVAKQGFIVLRWMECWFRSYLLRCQQFIKTTVVPVLLLSNVIKYMFLYNGVHIT